MKVICIDYNKDGLGVCKHENKVIFVHGLLVGEEANIAIIKEYKNYDEAEIVELLVPSKNRIKPVCNFYGECGGCDLMHMNDEEIKNFKISKVVNTLNKNLDKKIDEKDIVTRSNRGYRNKIMVHFDDQVGFKKKGSSDVVNIDECIVADKDYFNIISDIKKISSNIKRVMFRKSFYNNDVMVVLITKDKNLVKRDDLIKIILEHKNVASIYHNFHPKLNHNQLGDKSQLLYGKKFIIDKIGDKVFKITPSIFFQVNNEITKIIYDDIVKHSSINSKDTIVDAYCGIGTIGIYIADKVKKVIGIEVFKDSVKAAKENLIMNNISNVKFIEGRSESVITTIDKFDKIIVDPPRKGCNKSLIQNIISNNVEEIIYISCNPSTLARDLKLFEDSKYEISELKIYDMFGYTNHVEILAIVKKLP